MKFDTEGRPIDAEARFFVKEHCVSPSGLKFENNNTETQTVEANTYKDGEKVSSVKIKYLTQDQINFLDRIKDKICLMEK